MDSRAFLVSSVRVQCLPVCSKGLLRSIDLPSSDDESSDQTQSVPVYSDKQKSLMQKYTPLPSDTSTDDARRFLRDHKIIVDPVQRWSICLDCRLPVDWSMIYNHRRTEHHSRLSRMARIAGAFTDFPSEDQIIPKLLVLGANRQAPYTLNITTSM